MDNSNQLEYVKIEESFKNFLDKRVYEDTYPLLLKNPEYQKLNMENQKLKSKISELVPFDLIDEYVSNWGELLSIQTKFYYQQGINDGKDLKGLLGIKNSSYNIFATVTRRFEEIYDLIGKRLQSNKDYIKAIDKLNKLSEENKELAMEIASITSAIEAECQEEGYNQGFADAVKLFMTCMK